ncbi:hypothetical protein [Zavarzinia aquatilis]|uniref:Uncharacterized protein n=1 Tax=Zavarzinia aquatilis TaxID=2211142 RepID=A0A317E7A9_9PROT|nr:hypothetical protein [Zavarzinia aquatilis]PWR22511.1 hypothetical protein DKG74_11570 [Zavarzinia aquatilis]
MAALPLLMAACAETPAPRHRPLAPELPAGGLVGLTGPELPLLLGTPALRRSEPPAEIWQYSARDCLLHVFLYLDEDVLSVRHADARDRRGKPVDVNACAGRVGAEAAARAAARGGA